MKRDEATAELLAMPAEVEVVMGIGHYRVDVTGVNYDIERDQIVFDFPTDDMQYALDRLSRKGPSWINERKTI